ncbi:MAG: glycosyltransferase family 2 protein [Vicinamibacteraceae bacterium]
MHVTSRTVSGGSRALHASDATDGERDPRALKVGVIVPALNEEATIAAVISRVPYPPEWITVVDNGSTDQTAARACAAGARAVEEPRRGYGRACLAGIAANRDADVLVFIDVDLSEDPADIPTLVDPIAHGQADFVLGCRTGADRLWHAHVGTALCVWLINRLWRCAYRDLSPFRAIRRASLEALDMRDETWGWTIEMQVRAVEVGLRSMEPAVVSGARAGGRSKISGTLMGSIRAGAKMLGTILYLYVTRRRGIRVTSRHRTRPSEVQERGD